MRLLSILIFMVHSTLAQAGHGSSGGGQTHAEHFKAIGDQLVRFQRNYRALKALQTPSESESQSVRFLDGLSAADLEAHIAATHVQFLSSEDLTISTRFAWRSGHLYDMETGENDLAGIYVAEQRRIYVSPLKWDAASEIERYYLVRKEYWRGFSLENASEMRFYITWYFENKASDLKVVARSDLVTHGMRCVGASNNFFVLRPESSGGYALDISIRNGADLKHYNLTFPPNSCFQRLHARNAESKLGDDAVDFFAEIKCWHTQGDNGERYTFDTAVTEKIGDLSPPSHGAWSYSRIGLNAGLTFIRYPGEPDGNRRISAESYGTCRWVD